jgi:hypothetical protein
MKSPYHLELFLSWYDDVNQPVAVQRKKNNINSFWSWPSFISLLSYSLIGLAFSGSIGMTFLVLACALPQYR